MTGESDNESEDTDATLTRRQFVASSAGAAAVTAAGGFATHASATATTPDTIGSLRDLSIDGEPPYGRAQVSREGQRLLAEHEYEQQKKGNKIEYDTKLDAVKDLGCDPKGNEPIQDKIMDAAKDGVLIVFPPGIYLITEEISISVGGAFGLVGKGFRKSKKPPKPGKNSTVFKVKSSSPMRAMNFSPLDSGEIGNFVLDQKKSIQSGIQVQSISNVRVRDIRVVGAQRFVGDDDKTVPTLAPETPGEKSLLVVERFITRGGGIPGTKNIGGSPAFGVFGRSNSDGTIFLKDCIAENSPDNGIYGARTDANVYVHGGLYRNNDVNQVRVNGDARVNGVDVIIDEKNYTGLKTKSHDSPEKGRGVGWPAANGIKIETEPKIGTSTGTPIKNCNVVGASVADESRVGGLIYVWGSGGAVTTTNTRVTNNIKGTSSVLAEKPGSGDDPAAPKPWRFLMTNSVITGPAAGKGGPAVKTRGRPRSLVKKVCFKYPGASKDDISGPAVNNCGFGKKCKSAGLKAPKKVSKPKELPNITLPSNPTTPIDHKDFSERNPGILDGIANWFEDTVDFFADTLKGFMKMTILVIIGPLVALVVGAILFVGVFFVILLLIAAGLKGLKE